MDTHRDLIVLSGGVIILIIVCMLWLFAFLRVETVRTDIMIVEWFGVILGSGAAWFAITGAVDHLKKQVTIDRLRLLVFISGGLTVLIGIGSIIKSLDALL